ncbi:mannose-1-phosphate guanylyltransferase [Clostridium grantii]|uniref:mannose-1-phosphate guanylyltransferase n=1 Tax=Clostridium grantii DSM 8605 TaxID=1121316 RepID=A0A1M5XCP1_9CLOT|nr:mannose-1-phosphate guanylyltransferase [Clostridium grantii]SHH97432.1 mannose-1-phosphate guanylyltransferase [Clostridium grantii DSM 8605]
MVYVLILAGGRGTRLYPLSREKKPKQFLNVIDDNSFLRKTVDRVKSIVPMDNIYIVTNEIYKENILSEISELREENIFIEPANKETATCIGLSAVKLLKKDKDATMLVLPSDHYIKNEKLFGDTILEAIEVAQRKRGLVTLGIEPTRPETGYGYIKMGECIIAKMPTFKVDRFTEKPNIEVAKDFLITDSYLWNSGMFVWRADVFLREMEKYLPKTYRNLMEIYKVIDTDEEEKVLKQQYELIDGISVDFGILQKTRKAYVIKCSFDWDDIGSFLALGRFLNNYRGNNVKGNAFLEQSDNCYVFGDKKLIIGFGINDLIIIDTEDVVLVMKKEKDQEIKHLVNRLKEERMEEYL